MKHFLPCLILFSFAITTETFSATTFSGTQLLTACQAAADILDNNFGRVQIQSEYTQGNQSGICQGYIMSVTEGNRMTRLNRRRIPAFCLPANYNLLKGAVAIVSYLRRYPQQQRLQPNQIVVNAFRQYFPCYCVSLQ